jgi:hypothetical protein
MSKFKRAYLQQGKQRYNLHSVSLDITTRVGNSPKYVNSPQWEVKLEIDINDVWGIYKAWEKNPIFDLLVEWTSKRDKPEIEHMDGTIMILEIKEDKTRGATLPKVYFINAISSKLNLSTTAEFEPVKVQFD